MLVQPSFKANEQVQKISTATFSKKYALPLILDKRYERRKKNNKRGRKFYEGNNLEKN